MVRRFALLFALTLALPAAAYDLRRDSSGALVRWRGAVEFVLDARVGIQLNAAKVEQATRAALATLAQVAPNVTLSVRVGEPRPMGYDLAEPSKNQNDIVALTDWPYSDNALAATVVTVNGKTHEILDADIAFNLDGNAFGVLAPGEGRGAVNDVQNTLTHEFGHAMGLLHNAQNVKVVMYPSAPPGETSKRVLADDDSEALKVLYAEATMGTPSVASAAETGDSVPTVGCSASAGDLSFFAVVAALVLFARRRQALVLLAVPAMALAAAPELDLSRADEVAVGTVVSSKSSNRQGLFVTELEVSLVQCHKGGCAARLTVTVPGGKVGDLEQFVIDHPVPLQGESLAVTTTLGRQKVMRLADPETALRFERALKSLPQGSKGPQAVEPAPASSPQPSVKTH